MEFCLKFTRLFSLLIFVDPLLKQSLDCSLIVLQLIQKVGLALQEIPLLSHSSPIFENLILFQHSLEGFLDECRNSRFFLGKLQKWPYIKIPKTTQIVIHIRSLYFQFPTAQNPTPRVLCFALAPCEVNHDTKTTAKLGLHVIVASGIGKL